MKVSIDAREVFKLVEPFIISVKELGKSEVLIFKDIGFLMAYRVFLSSIKLECKENKEVSSFLDEKSAEIQSVINIAMDKLCKLVEARSHLGDS